jgi:hypothetical protein
MPKNNYSFEKRRKELERKSKKEKKKQEKLGRQGEPGEDSGGEAATEPEAAPTQE